MDKDHYEYLKHYLATGKFKVVPGAPDTWAESKNLISDDDRVKALRESDLVITRNELDLFETNAMKVVDNAIDGMMKTT